MLTSSSYLKIATPLLFAFILTMPLANRDIFTLVFDRIFPVRLILILLISLSLFYLLVNFVRSSAKRQWLQEKINQMGNDFLLKLLLMLWLIRLISIWNSLNFKASFNLLLFYSGMIALYLMMRFYYENQRKVLSRLFNFHLIVTSLVALFGFGQLILAFFGVRLPGVLVGSTFVRIPATFYDTNHLPAYLLTAFPVLFILYFYQRSEVRRFLWLILLGVYAVVTLFTFSRSGFLSFSIAVFILTLVFLKKRYWHKALLVLSTVLVAALIIYLTSQTQLSLFKRLASVFNLEDKSTVAHGLLYYGGIELFAKSPIIGQGYGSFSEHFRGSAIGFEQSLFDPATNVRIPPHSIWLEVLVETGLLGFVLYFWLIAIIIEKCWQALKIIKEPRYFLVHLALFSSLVGILVGGLFYSYNLEFFWFFLFFIFFQSRAVLEMNQNLAGENILDLTPEGREKLPLKDLIYLFCLGVLSVSLIFSGLGLLPVLPGAEGLTAAVGKVMRIDWGYGVVGWWRPHYLGQLIETGPLPFLLVAFWTILFDYGASVIRFFPALAGFLAVIVFFFWQRSRRSLAFAFFASLVLFALPGFLNAARFGNGDSYLVLGGCLTIFLIWQIFSRKRTYLFFVLILALALFSLINYVAYLLMLLWLLAWFSFQSIKKRFSPWAIFFLLSSALPMVLWFGQWRKFDPNFSLGSVLNQDLTVFGLVSIVYFILLPALVTLVADLIYDRGGLFWLFLLTVSILFFFVSSFQGPANFELARLIQARLNVNRDGRIPLYLTAHLGEDSVYYSEVPITQISTSDLEKKIESDENFYAITDGSILRDFKKGGVSNFFIIAVEKQSALIEKPGP